MNSKPYTVVCVLAAPRTGSTLIDLILGSHSEAVSVGELVYWNERPCTYCGEGCHYFERFRRESKIKGAYDCVFELFGKRLIIDSSKKLRWVKSQRDHLDRFRFIRIIRDGHDRLFTVKNWRGHITKRDIRRWIRREKRISRFLRGRPHLVIKYEEMCTEEGVRVICEYLGITFEPAMMRFWEFEHHGIGNVKTYGLVRAHHGKELSESQRSFVEKHGFKIEMRKRVDFMSADDKRLWQKYGAGFNRELGYED